MDAPDAEVVIVGAGVMGLATARELARAGRDVVVCEQFELGHARGSSHGGSRIVRLSYPAEHWVRLARESFPLWRELAGDSGSELLDLRGTLDLGDWEPNRDALSACGIRHEVLDATEIERRFPVRAEPGTRGLFQPDGGVVLADAAIEALASGAVEAGARVLERCRVERLEQDAAGVTAGGVRADVAVVTAGPWAPGLAGFEATPSLETTSFFAFDEPVPSVIDTTTGVHPGFALTAPPGLLKAGLHKSGRIAEPDEPAEPDPVAVERTAAWVERRFRGVGEQTRAETCFYTLRADDEFLLERRGRVVVGSACSGHGFKFAPLIGKRLAALALEGLAAERPL